MKLYVGNFVYNTTELQLRELFSTQGFVANVRIIHDQFTRQSKCYGYVKMLTKKGAEKAINTLNGKKINANSLVVKKASRI
jgi:RNA recognition motif-containing protein